MSRTAVALMLVLAAVSALAVAAAAIATTATANRRQRVEAEEAAQVDLLRADAEALACQWLAERGTRMSTPITDAYRPTRIMSARIDDRSGPIAVDVWAWDALSGIPVLGEHPPALPPDLQPPAIQDPAVWWLEAASAARPCFPTWSGGVPVVTPLPTVLLCSPWSDGTINWRTAPWELVVRSALRSHTEDRLDVIRRLRDAPARDDMAGGEPLVWEGVTDHTARWLISLRVETASLRRAWFLVVDANGHPPSILIRHAIPAN